MSIRGYPAYSKQQLFYTPDPFLYHNKTLEDDHQYLRETFSSSPFDSDVFLFDQHCPSSGPSSPGSTYSSSQSNLYSSSNQTPIKQEPFFDEFAVNFPCNLPPFDDLNDNLCELPVTFDLQSSPSAVNYEDWIDLYGINHQPTEQVFDSLAGNLLIDDEMENVMGSIDSVAPPATTNTQLVSHNKPGRPPKVAVATKSRSAVTTRAKRNSPPTQAQIISPASSFASLDTHATTVSFSVGSGSRSGSVTSSAEGSNASKGSSLKKLKGTDAYADRRRKNNIAVRKSREKKRQEITRFTEEHMKLQRQCELLKQNNEKLMKVLNDVQEALVEDKAIPVVKSIIVSAKKQLSMP